MVIRRLVLIVIVVGPADRLSAREPWGTPVATTRINCGELSAIFRDNSESPQRLSGLGRLVNTKHAPGYSAFTQHGGLNLEHIISGHRDPQNRFAPRFGRFSLHRLPDERSVVLVRRQQDSPWRVSSTLHFTVTPPHYVDFRFRCTPHDKTRFGKRGYALFFFANYVNDVAEVPIRFLGIERPGSNEQWIVADASEWHPDWNQGGTYRGADATDLQYDEDQQFRLNNWSYDYPRFTRPFYYGKSKRGMVLILMFDRTCREEDQIRFSLFKFMAPKSPPDGPKHPARDFQYVINRVEAEKEYGFKGRLVWKPFVSPADCREEYEQWLGQVGPP